MTDGSLMDLPPGRLRSRQTRSAVAGPRRSRCDERGTALVEAAIALPLLLLLLFGMIDFGSVYNDYLSVRQGTREGARTAAVNTEPNDGTWNSTNCPMGPGGPTSGDGYDLICATKDYIGLNKANTRVKVYFVAGVTPNPCGAPFCAGQSVIICTQYPATGPSGFMSAWLTGKVLTSKIEIRIEQNGKSQSFNAPVAENPLTSSWSPSCQQF